MDDWLGRELKPDGHWTATKCPYVSSMQPSLFPEESLPLPQGLYIVPEFLSEAEEAALLCAIDSLALTEARYKQYTARRRVASFGGKFDYDTSELRAAPPIPSSLYRCAVG
jgi:hypothetical protein